MSDIPATGSDLESERDVLSQVTKVGASVLAELTAESIVTFHKAVRDSDLDADQVIIFTEWFAQRVMDYYLSTVVEAYIPDLDELLEEDDDL